MLILHKDNPSKHKCSFEIMISFIKEKTWLTLCEKVIAPKSNNWLCHPLRWLAILQSSRSPSHRWGGIVAHSLQNGFNSATLEGFRAWKDCLRSCHSISILSQSISEFFRTLTWPLQNINLVFLEPFRGGLVLVSFGSLSCCITQVSLRSQTDGQTISFGIFWVQNS